jgi:hypothetical protein
MENNPITRVFPDFQDELQKIDLRLSIVANPNRPKIANIKLDGTDICPIPNYEIREHKDAGYTIEMPNGSLMPHRSKEEALIMIKQTLEFIKNPENADAFFGRGQYQ